MNKKFLISLVFVSLLIGFVSAALVPFLSNFISGTAEVKEPVFYLDGYLEGVYYDLYLNEIPSFEEEAYIFDGNRILFITQALNIDYLYESEFNINIWAKTNVRGNILQFQIVKIKPNLEEEIICTPQTINISSWYDQFRKRETSCTSNGIIELNPNDRLGLIISGAGGTSEYWISTGKKYTDGYSRIEISKT